MELGSVKITAYMDEWHKGNKGWTIPSSYVV